MVGGRHEQHEVRVGGEDRQTLDRGELSDDAIALGTDRFEDRHRLGCVAERDDPGGLCEGREMVGQPDTLQVVDDLWTREHVPEPGAGHREGLREGAHHREVRMVGDELERALTSELDVGLVHDHERVGRIGEMGHHVERLDGAGRIVRRAHEDHVGRADERLVDRGLGEHERIVEPPAGHVGVGEPAHASVQLIGRLEDRRGAARTAVREEQLGEHLVRAVRGPRPFDGVAEVCGEILAQPGHLAVGVAVQR